MSKVQDVCMICESWNPDVECEYKDDCPINALKQENKQLKEKIQKLKSDASWDYEISHSDYRRDFW